jgi:hypothetical protein
MLVTVVFDRLPFAASWNLESTTLSGVLEEGIETLPCLIASAGIRATGHEDRIRLEIIAVVGGFFVANPFGLGFSALIVLSGIVEAAVAAAVQVSIACRACVAGHDAFQHVNLFTAFKAGKPHKPGYERWPERALAP